MLTCVIGMPLIPIIDLNKDQFTTMLHAICYMIVFIELSLIVLYDIVSDNTLSYTMVMMSVMLVETYTKSYKCHAGGNIH